MNNNLSNSNTSFNNLSFSSNNPSLSQLKKAEISKNSYSGYPAALVNLACFENGRVHATYDDNSALILHAGFSKTLSKLRVPHILPQ